MTIESESDNTLGISEVSVQQANDDHKDIISRVIPTTDDRKLLINMVEYYVIWQNTIFYSKILYLIVKKLYFLVKYYILE